MRGASPHWSGRPIFAPPVRRRHGREGRAGRSARSPPTPSTAVPSLVPGGAAEGGQRLPSLAGRFLDGPRPAESGEKNDASEIYHGQVRERVLGVFKLWFPCTFASARPSTRQIRHKTGSPSLVSQPHDLWSCAGPRHGVRARACRSCGAVDAILAIYQRSKAVRRRPS